MSDIEETIGTVGWYLGGDEGHPKGWILCWELKEYRAIELDCCGYDDDGVFKLERKLQELFGTAGANAREKGYSTFRTGMSSLNFNIHGRPIESIPEAIMHLTTSDRLSVAAGVWVPGDRDTAKRMGEKPSPHHAGKGTVKRCT